MKKRHDGNLDSDLKIEVEMSSLSKLADLLNNHIIAVAIVLVAGFAIVVHLLAFKKSVEPNFDFNAKVNDDSKKKPNRLKKVFRFYFLSAL